MDPKATSSYKNFLPSKKFITVVGLIALVAVLCFVVPKLVTYVTSHKKTGVAGTGLTMIIPKGDPTTRDSDGDGVPDWEEIAVGLNPNSPQTTLGTPDAIAFERIKNTVGPVNFQNVADAATDSDKVGLALFSDLSQNSMSSGATSDDQVSAVTGAEVANYIQAAQTKNKTYSSANLTLTDNSQTSVRAYYKAMNGLNGTVLGKDFVTHVSAYINNQENKDAYLTAQLATIDSMITQLLAMPVPSTAVSIHLAGINALSGIEQTINTYDQTTTDNLSQLGTVGLVEDYTRAAIIANADLGQYFSVALETKPSK